MKCSINFFEAFDISKKEIIMLFMTWLLIGINLWLSICKYPRGLYFQEKFQNHWSAFGDICQLSGTIFSRISQIWLDLARNCWSFAKFEPFLLDWVVKNPISLDWVDKNPNSLECFHLSQVKIETSERLKYPQPLFVRESFNMWKNVNYMEIF